MQGRPGISSEGSGKPLEVLSKGPSRSDLCVKTLSKQNSELCSLPWVQGGATPACPAAWRRGISGPALGPTTGQAHCSQGSHLEELGTGFSGPYLRE